MANLQDIEEVHKAAHAARRFLSAAHARLLTNNMAPGIQTPLVLAGQAMGVLFQATPTPGDKLELRAHESLDLWLRASDANGKNGVRFQYPATPVFKAGVFQYLDLGTMYPGYIFEDENGNPIPGNAGVNFATIPKP